MTLAQKQAHRPMKQNKEPRNEPPFNGQFRTEETRKYNREKTISSISGVEKTGQLHAKESNWTTHSHHAQK